MGNEILFIDNIHYIPNLTETIYSLFVHIQSPCHGLQSSFEHGLFIIFPTSGQRQLLAPMISTLMQFLLIHASSTMMSVVLVPL